jgi:hypothetical protein
MKGLYGVRGLALLLGVAAGDASAQAFTQHALLVAVSNPTSLQFGPDGRLYVSEQYGRVHAFSIERQSDGGYIATGSETIDAIRAIANHDDDGSACSADCNQRQVTGLLVAGTAQAPLLYVTSSDARVSVASDSNLDTNSGMLTRLTCSGGIVSGQCQAWTRVDLVRGLPRSEENHATNGMDLDPATNTLYIANGGNTNKGAISNSFSGIPEYFFAGAVIAVDLDALAAMEAANGGAFTDARDGSRFVYDLLTLDDPTRANIDKTHPDFPYGPGHPWRNLSIDPGDPFGGNDGYNQAVPEAGGPVQVHSPGYRNPYDVVVTRSGEIYTWDNGPNSGWGGTPWIYTAGGALKGYSTQPGIAFDAGAGDWCSNEINESGSGTQGDALHRITTPGYYGGHPAPTRAFPARAGLYDYEQQPDGHWVHSGPVYQLTDRLPAGYGTVAADFPDDPRQCDYTVPAGGLETINASTNGLTEYTADNFNGAMRGDLLAASFNGNLYRCKPDGAGGLVDLPGSSGGTTEGRCEVLLGGFGSQPLDVTAQGDDDVFPGTIWAATYGANSIVVFEPTDFACDPSVPGEDSDSDGFSNGDEAANGTNACSAGSRPEDFDGDFVSDLTDGDDDNDGIADVEDIFALDASNGTAQSLPVHLPLFNNDPGTGLFGLGFTGLMLARNGSATWREGFDPETLAAGGAAGLLTVESVSAGTAAGGANTQDHGFLFGIDAHGATPPFAATARLRSPWFEINGAAGTPQAGQSYGLFVGTGDQDNYASLVLAGAGGGSGVLQLGVEIAGSATTTTFAAQDWGGANLLAASSLDLSLLVDPQAATVQPRVSIGGAPAIALGAPRPIPAAWLSGSDARGLAVGAISTRGNSGVAFGATWDAFTVDFVAGSAPGAWTRVDDFPATRHEGGFVQAGTRFYALGGREADTVLRWDPASGNWSSGAASPIKLHHFQAVEVDGLIYAVGAMTGECCSEPPAANVYVYDPLADRWSTGPAIPAARRRGGGGAVAADGKIYLIGGNASGHNGPVSALVDVFDPATGRFTALAPMPHARDHAFAVQHGGRIYVAGGRESNATADGDVFDDTVAEVDVYDIASNTWSTLPESADLPTPRAAAATGIVGNELLVAGGESAAQSGAHAQVEALDLGTLRWRTLAPMRTPRHAAQAIVNNHGFYVAGGAGQRGGATAPLDLEALHLFGSTPVAGTALVASTLQATPQLDFGRVAVGDSRALPATLTLANGGNQAVLVSGLTASNGAFRVVQPPTLPFAVAPGATLALQVEFEPHAQGPLQGTLAIASPGRSPVNVALAGEGFGSVDAQVLYRINVGGPQVAALDAPAPAWTADTVGAPSAYRVEGGGEQFDDAQGGAYGGSIDMTDASLPANVPAQVFQSERWDPPAAPEMRWAFPVPAGTLVEVRLFFAELYAGTDNPGERVFDVRVEGSVPPEFNDIDRYAQAGPKGAILRAALITTSGPTLDLEFLHVLENPAINAIEIRAIEGAPNIAPVARDDYASVATGGSVSIPVLANDNDSDGTLDPASLVVVRAPASGSVQAVGGAFQYTHGAGSAWSDLFVYAVRDDDGELSNAATVYVRRDEPALPADVDGDGLANEADPDDDNDGRPDTSDAFALDPADGLASALPQRLDLVPAPSLGGLFDLGFTGLMTNGSSNYAALFDPTRVFLGGGTPRLTLANVDDGTAAGSANSQTQGLQLGIDVDALDDKFVLRAELHAPFFDGAPQAGQAQGLQLGRGTQDSYAALLLDAGTMQLKLHREDAGQATVLPIAATGLASARRIDLMLLVDPQAAALRPMLAVDGGAPQFVGELVPLPAAWFSATDSQGLALGLIATSAGAAPPFAAHWQALEANWLAADDVYDFGSPNGTRTLAVQANDGAAPGRRITALGMPDRGGSVSLHDNGTPAVYEDDVVRYTAAPAASGVETFTYTVTTASGWNATAAVAVGIGSGAAVFANGFED